MVHKIVPVVHKYKLSDHVSDYEYWRNQPYEARLAIVEEMRRDYYNWLASTTGSPPYGELKFPKVFRIVKLSDSDV
jgi:hypothetical protein